MMPTGSNADSKARESHPKEWRRPELRKLPVEATASSPSKGGLANSDVFGGPKVADAAGQYS